MKAIIFYISLLLSCNLINGQTCLQNGSFANACTNVIVSSHGDCPTWTDACGDGWVRSHGTPQMIFYNDGNHSGFYAFMWAEHTSSTGTFYDGGEGMFTQ